MQFPLLIWTNISVLSVIGLSFALIWKLGRRREVTGAWALAYLFMAAAWAFISQYSITPDWFTLVNNSALFISVVCVAVGLTNWLNRKIKWHYLILILLATLFAESWFLFETPSLLIRTAIISCVIGGLYCWAAYLVFSKKAPDKRFSACLKGAGVFISLMAFVAFMQAPIMYFDIPIPDRFSIPANLLILLVIQPALQTGIGIFLLLIITVELVIDLESLSVTDPLTRLYNRRGFDIHTKREMNNMSRTGTTLSVIACDLDHFKRVNDTFGHDTGDRVLVIFANMLMGQVRPSDIVARVGGEEFTILLPDTDVVSAGEIAERMRIKLHSIEIEETDPIYRPRASFGISELLPGEDSIDGALIRADKALYNAKDLGRDRVEIFRADEFATDE